MKYPIIIAEIPHTLPPIVYEVLNTSALKDLAIYHDIFSEDDETIIEELTNDNHTHLVLNEETAKDLAFNENQTIYKGHQQYKLIGVMKKFLKNREAK